MKKKVFKPDTLLSHESGVRKLEAEAAQRQYVSFTSLAQAQSDPEGVVIFEGDDGGQIYLVFPARLVRCSEDNLRRLLHDIDALAWKDPSAAHIYYERLPIGSTVLGGKGGGIVQDSIWLHPKLEKMGISQAVEAVIEGRKDTLETVH